MSYIPKSAKRKIEAYKRMQKDAPVHYAPIDVEPPSTLVSGQPGAGMWDVYFNGEKQHLCTFAGVSANENHGRITRYIHGRGNTGIGKQTETLMGVVEIVRKGQPCTYQAPVPTPSLPPIAAPAARQARTRVLGGARVLALAAAAVLCGSSTNED